MTLPSPRGCPSVTPPDVVATIAIPLHNHARYIGSLLNSLFAQWRPEFELVLIDDASSDDGFGMAQAILARHPEVRATAMRTEQAEGMGLIGRILRLARGRIVVRADSDDIALPGRLDAILSCFAGDAGCRLVTTNALLVADDGRPFSVYDTRSSSVVLRDPAAAAATVGDSRWLGATMAYHRDVYDRFPPLDPELCPYGLDLLLPFRALLLGSHHYLAEPLVAWRQHGANTHRTSGHYEEAGAAQEPYRALYLMVLAQRVRDAAFFAAHEPSPPLEEVLRLCRQTFDARFDDWCRLRSRAAVEGRRGAASARAGHGAPVPPIATVADGETLRFAEGELGAALLAGYAGYHRPEAWGTWTERVAHLSLRVATVSTRAFHLRLRLVAPHLVAWQRVAIRVGAGDWAEVEVGSAQPSDVILSCPSPLGTQIVDITFVVRDALVPAQADASDPDPRLLGVGLVSATVLGGPAPSADRPGGAAEQAETAEAAAGIGA